MVTLKELAQQIDGASLTELFENKNILEYVDAIGGCGADIIRNQSNYQQIKCASALIGSKVLANLSDEIDPTIYLVLLTNSSDFMKIVMFTLKLSIGLAALEELH